jgi:tetratricopeptide (TPR) repeat protein
MLRCLAARVALGVLLISGRAGATTEACGELVRQGHAQEAGGFDQRALARYGEAIRIDASCSAAYLAVGELRGKLGDWPESERVLSAALERFPDFFVGRLARARALRVLGRSAGAEADAQAVVESSSDVALAIAALREMARWYDADQARPAQLAVWRRLRWIGQKSGSVALEREAGAMVRALVIVVGGADTVTSPPRSDAFRLGVARAERWSGP